MIYYMNIGLALMALLSLATLAPRRARLALAAIMVLMVVGIFSLATWWDAALGYVDPALHDNWSTFGASCFACGNVLYWRMMWALIAERMVNRYYYW
jgi:hypothetical protein